MADPPNNAPPPEPIPLDPEFEIEEEGFAAEPALPEEQYCIFRAGRERYCLHVLDVDEVVEWPRLTYLPLSPPFLMGVFNLRGTIVPVVDIAFTEVRRADLPPKQVVVACLRAPRCRARRALGNRGGRGDRHLQHQRASAERRGAARCSALRRDAAPRRPAGAGAGFETRVGVVSGGRDLKPGTVAASSHTVFGAPWRSSVRRRVSVRGRRVVPEVL